MLTICKRTYTVLSDFHLYDNNLLDFKVILKSSKVFKTLSYNILGTQLVIVLKARDTHPQEPTIIKISRNYNKNLLNVLPPL